MPAHVRKGDTVMVTAGSDRGRTGTVLKVIPKRSAVIVQGLNTRIKHLKPSQTNPQGGVITREMPIHLSNVSPVVDGRATRVRFLVKDDGSKVRVAARGGGELGPVHGPRESHGAAGARTAHARRTSPKKKHTRARAGAKKGAAKAGSGKAAGRKAASSTKKTGTGRKT